MERSVGLLLKEIEQKYNFCKKNFTISKSEKDIIILGVCENMGKKTVPFTST